MSLRALIFDVDGTLAETEEAHRAAFNAAFSAAGLDWHWSRTDYGRLLTPTGGQERMARWRQETGSGPSDAAIAALHRDKTARYAVSYTHLDVYKRQCRRRGRDDHASR